MSKKRRNRKTSFETISLGLSSSSRNQPSNVTQSEKSQASSRLAVFARLKKHWWAVGLVALLSLGTLGATLKYLEEDAQRQMLARSKSGTANQSNGSLLNSVNPFLSPPSPTPTPQLAKEYIYAGSRLLAVEDANAVANPPTDLAVWRPSNGTWYVMGGTGSQQVSVTWGQTGDDPVPGDFDGDGKTDFSVLRTASGTSSTWYVQNTSSNTMSSYNLGSSGDERAQADYDGDGKTDPAVFRPSNNTWYIQRSSDGVLAAHAFGSSALSDVPAPADFDGDGKADIAVWRAGDLKFYYLMSSTNNGSFQMISVSQGGTKPVPADYDGDGKADAAVWGSGTYSNNWHIVTSSGTAIAPISFGVLATDEPVHNDYDGDGKVDRAVWRPSNGTWYISQSTKLGQVDEIRQVQWGTNGDIPVPAFYRR